MVTLCTGFDEEQIKQIEDLKDNLKIIKQKCGISRDTHWQEGYIISRKQALMRFLDVIETIDSEPFDVTEGWSFSEEEYDTIYKTLSKIKKKILKIDSKLEDVYKELIVFNECAEDEKERLEELD